MSEQIKEMNLPVISVAPIGADVGAEPGPAPQEAEYTDSVVVGTPVNEYPSNRVTIYAQSITSAGYSEDESIAKFDVVFSVGVCCEDGSTKTYQVVKRIGVDKCKLAAEAACSTPVSIVEAKKEDAKVTAKRFRVLAGLE